jgi:hypothetical protein
MSGKIAGAAMGGVALPIVIEFAAKGKRISDDKFPFKWSGVIGTVGGLFTGVVPLAWKNYPLTKNMTEPNKNALIAGGASMFATGLSILILDELRKRAAYQFRGGNVPLTVESEDLAIPSERLIKEI